MKFWHKVILKLSLIGVQARGRTRSGCIPVLFLLLLVTIAEVLPSSASPSNWVTVISVQDLTDNVQLRADQPLIAGHSYNVTTSIDVPFTQALSEFQVSLGQEMGLHGSQFWYLETADYGGYDPSKFTAGLRTITFNQLKGKLILSGLFSVPQNFTTTFAETISLHLIKSDVKIISVTVTGGAIVGELVANISDEAIQRYLIIYLQKSTLISTGKVDSAYSRFVSDILDQAQAIYLMGLPEKATDLLDVLSTEAFPQPPNNLFTFILLGAAAVLVAVVVVVVLLLLRTRGRISILSDTMGYVQKELAVLEVTVSQYDKLLAERIRELKNRLSETF